jgi:hypothetical protein
MCRCHINRLTIPDKTLTETGLIEIDSTCLISNSYIMIKLSELIIKMHLFNNSITIQPI